MPCERGVGGGVARRCKARETALRTQFYRAYGRKRTGVRISAAGALARAVPHGFAESASAMKKRRFFPPLCIVFDE